MPRAAGGGGGGGKAMTLLLLSAVLARGATSSWTAAGVGAQEDPYHGATAAVRDVFGDGCIVSRDRHGRNQGMECTTKQSDIW